MSWQDAPVIDAPSDSPRAAWESAPEISAGPSWQDAPEVAPTSTQPSAVMPKTALMAQTASAGLAIPPIQKPGGLRGFHNAVRASEASIVPNLIRAGTSRTSRVLAAMSTGGISEAIRPIIGQDKIEHDANVKARAMQQAIQTALPYDPDSIGGTLGEFAGSAERMAPAIVYPPAAPLVLGTMGAETLGQSYLDSDARGITDVHADLNAAGKAAIEVGTEMVGLKFLGKAKNVGKAIANKAIGSTAANAAGVVAGGAAEESVAQIGQNIVGETTGVTPEVGITDGVPKAALGGALLSGGVVGTAYVGNRIANAWEQAPVIETAPEPASPPEPTEFDRQEAAIDAKEPEWSKAPLAGEFPATPAWQEALEVDSAAKDAAIVQSENEQVADAQLRNLWQRRQQELMQREFDEYAKAEEATQAQQRQRDLEAADEEDIVAEVAGEAAKAEPTQYTEEELAGADVRKIADEVGVRYDTDAMTIPRILANQDVRRIAKLDDKELYWALKDRGVRMPAARGDRINELLNFIEQNRKKQEQGYADERVQTDFSGARAGSVKGVPPADVSGQLRNPENLPAQQPGLDLPESNREVSGPSSTAAAAPTPEPPREPRSVAERESVGSAPWMSGSRAEHWFNQRQKLRNNVGRVTRKDLEPFAGEPWADERIAKFGPPKPPASPEAISNRRSELEMELRDAIVYERGSEVFDVGSKHPLALQTARGEKPPGMMVSLETAVAEAEKLPESHPARMILHNLRELQKNPRGTKIQKFNTNEVEDGSRVVVNSGEVLTIDREEGVVRDGITSEIPEGGLTLYGKEVLPPQYAEDDVNLGSAPFSEVEDRPKSDTVSGEDSGPPTTYDAPEGGPTSDTGVFGQEILRPATGNNQAGLFHEPVKVEQPESEQIGSKSARDPKNTGKLFSPSPAFKQPKNMVPAAPKTVSPPEMIKAMEEAAGTPFRVGRGGFARKRAAGWYNLGTDVVRQRIANELDVAAHEFGHAMHAKILGWKSQIPAPVNGELVKLGKELYGSRKPNGGYAAEGMAEFVARHFLGDPDLAKVAPNTSQWLPAALSLRPEFRKQFDAIKGMFDAWNAQGAIARVESQINKVQNDLKTQVENLRTKATELINPKWWTNDAHKMDQAVANLLASNGLNADDVPAVVNPTKVYRALQMSAPGTARYFLFKSAVDPRGESVGPSLAKVLEPVREKVDDFLTYAYAKRAMLLLDRGVNPGISREDAAYTVRQLQSPEFDDAVDGLTTWSGHLLDYVVDAGGLTADAAKAIRTLNPIYLPLKRHFDDSQLGGAKGSKRGVVNQGSAVKKIKGSGRQIINPLESLVAQAEQMISLGNKIRVARAIVDLAESTKGAGWFAEKVETPQSATSFKVEDIARQLEQAGANLDQANLDQVMTVFTNAYFASGRDNVVSVWKNGQREFYELHPEVFRTVTEMDKDSLPAFVRMLTAPLARLVRLGATQLQPGFAVANFARDVFAPLIWGRSQIPLSAFHGIYRKLREAAGRSDPTLEKFEASGVPMSTMAGFDRGATTKVVSDVLRKPNKVVQTFRHPIDAMRAVLEEIEKAPRVVEFSKALAEAEAKWGTGSESALIEAMIAAKDVTVDFTRAGVIGRVLNQIIPFFNAGVQGTSKMYRETKKNPLRVALRGLQWVAIPSLLLWWINRDEDWYRELPDREKLDYWHFSVDGGKSVFRIPKPFEIGRIFGSIPEAMADHLYGEDKSRVSHHLWESFKDFMPISSGWEVAGVFRPVLEAIANYDHYRDRPIVPQNQVQRRLPEDQYQKWTTDTAKVIGRWLNVSPTKVEHVVRQSTGGLGLDAMRFADSIRGQGKGRSSIPFFGRFMSRPLSAQSKSVDDFYEERDQLRRIIGSRKAKREESNSDDDRRLRSFESIARYIDKVRDDIDVGEVEEAEGNRRIINAAREALKRRPLKE